MCKVWVHVFLQSPPNSSHSDHIPECRGLNKQSTFYLKSHNEPERVESPCNSTDSDDWTCLRDVTYTVFRSVHEFEVAILIFPSIIPSGIEHIYVQMTSLLSKDGFTHIIHIVSFFQIG